MSKLEKMLAAGTAVAVEPYVAFMCSRSGLKVVERECAGGEFEYFALSSEAGVERVKELAEMRKCVGRC